MASLYNSIKSKEERDAVQKRKLVGARPQMMLESGTGLIEPPSPMAAKPAPLARPMAASTPTPVVDRSAMYSRIAANEEQKRLRGSLRDKQEGFRYLAPEQRDAARGEMADIRNAHRGISAANAQVQPQQTPEQIAANRARLASILTGELRKQEAAGQGRLDELSSGAGLRQSAVDAGARMAPGLAAPKFTDVRDQFNQRDALAFVGNQPGQMDWKNAESADPRLARPSPAQIARSEERARVQENLARVRGAIPDAQSGAVFGPTPTVDQLNAETANNAATRDATIKLGEESRAKIIAQREEQAALKKASADRARLGLDAENAQLRQVVAGQGPQDTENKIRETEAQARLAEATARRQDAVSTGAMQRTGITDPQALASRVGETARSAIASSDVGAINQIADVELPQIEALAKIDPSTAAAVARAALATLPGESELGQYASETGFGGAVSKVRQSITGTPISPLYGPAVLGEALASRRRGVANVARAIRARLQALIMPGSAPQPQPVPPQQ